MSTLRRSKASASTPPTTPSTTPASSSAMNVSDVASGDPVRAYTYGGSTTVVMPSPSSDTNWAETIRRNCGRRNGPNTARRDGRATVETLTIRTVRPPPHSGSSGWMPHKGMLVGMNGGVPTPRNAVVVLLDSLNRHLLGAYGGAEFDTPNLDRFARAVGALRPPLRRLAAVHAGPPRHAVRRRSTSCGGRGARSRSGRTPITYAPAARRRDDDAGLRPPAPVRDRRRELPHRLHAPGTTCAATRATRGRPAPDPSWVGAPALPAASSHAPLRRRRAPGSASEADFPGPRTMAAAARVARRAGAGARPLPAVRRRVRPARAVRHARAVGVAVRPGRGRAPHVIWPPYAVDAVRQRRLDEREARAHPRQLRRQAVDDRPLVRPGARRARPQRTRGTTPR